MTDTIIRYEGREYRLIKDAYVTNAGAPARVVYESYAVRVDETPDENGWLTAYEVTWELLDSYNPDEDDESWACDWDYPVSVEDIGVQYSPEQNRFF